MDADLFTLDQQIHFQLCCQAWQIVYTKKAWRTQSMRCVTNGRPRHTLGVVSSESFTRQCIISILEALIIRVRVESLLR